jgi:hypothetical protein
VGGPFGTLRGRCLDEVPPVDPDAAKWPEGRVRHVPHPFSPDWSVNLDSMPEPHDTWKTIGDWMAQRAVEERMLEEMAAILKDRGKDAPGLILFRLPTETAIMESQWIPAGTLIYSCQDQPDLMVRIDPEDERVIYYRQTGRAR